ncbi:hypothetical protein BFJ69_g17741 [Fusarium oxysporum]|uniref:Uncharacterized protein n=1 Tax=Fusarium oxysporum TaxID=5507 RepID=A0A420M7F2_FUSOX|nr:hypothetical protein BFJ69_g17741 [Fusarium oxysporum]
MSTKELAQNGWTAVPVDAGKIFQNGPYTNEPDYVDVNSIEFPSNDPIVSKTQQYAKVHLLKQTYHHSMRVYYWGGIGHSETAVSRTREYSLTFDASTSLSVA